VICITFKTKSTGFLQRALLCLILALWIGSPALSAEDATDPSREEYLQAMRLMAAGDREAASRLLSRIVQNTPQHAGAMLDLAIVQCELGNAQTAAWLFQSVVERFRPPPDMIEMIRTLQASGCLGPATANQGRRHFIYLARGTDSNVNRGASTRFFTIAGPTGPGLTLPIADAYLPKSDQFLLLAGELTREFRPSGMPAFRGFVQFQARRHDSLSAYDTNLLGVGAELPFQAASWEWRATGSASGLTYGGNFYQAQQRLELFAAPLAQPLPNARIGGLAAITRTAYRSLPNFDSRASELGLQIEAGSRRLLFKGNLGVARDDAIANRPGGDRSGSFASGLAQFAIVGELVGEVSITEQRWDGSSNYAPGIIDRIRNQRLRSGAASLMLPITRNQGLRLELRQTRNRESIPIFAYEGRQIALGWQWLVD